MRNAACDWYTRPQSDERLSFTSALTFDSSGLSAAAPSFSITYTESNMDAP